MNEILARLRLGRRGFNETHEPRDFVVQSYEGMDVLQVVCGVVWLLLLLLFLLTPAGAHPRRVRAQDVRSSKGDQMGKAETRQMGKCAVHFNIILDKDQRHRSAMKLTWRVGEAGVKIGKVHLLTDPG